MPRGWTRLYFAAWGSGRRRARFGPGDVHLDVNQRVGAGVFIGVRRAFGHHDDVPGFVHVYDFAATLGQTSLDDCNDGCAADVCVGCLVLPGS